MPWRWRLRAPLRVKLAAAFFALVVLAGGALLLLGQALTVSAVRGVAPFQVVGPGWLSPAKAQAAFGQANASIIVHLGRLNIVVPTLVLPAPQKVVNITLSPAAAVHATVHVRPPDGAILHGTLTAKALPRTVTALAGFRSQVEETTIRASLEQSAIALGVIAALSALVAWLVAGRALTPLKAVTSAARHLSEATLHERIRMQGPQDEIKDLADTFDDMLRRLDGAFQSQRNFMANVSHELRTPLALQRTLVDVALADEKATPEDLREALAAVSESVEEQRRLVEGLLLLAVSERGPAERVGVDVGAVVETALAAARPDAEAAGVTLRQALVSATVLGDSALLTRLFGNLLENAIRYNVPEGWVEVEMAVSDGRVRTLVRNPGPVVEADAVDALFEPFRRLGGERTGEGGAGLGLSIARAVAVAHGGTIRAVPREGGGLELVVDLPVMAATAPA